MVLLLQQLRALRVKTHVGRRGVGFQDMVPPTSVAIAALFLHEPISPALGLGTVCILIGLVATQIASTARRATVTASAR